MVSTKTLATLALLGASCLGAGKGAGDPPPPHPAASTGRARLLDFYPDQLTELKLDGAGAIKLERVRDGAYRTATLEPEEARALWSAIDASAPAAEEPRGRRVLSSLRVDDPNNSTYARACIEGTPCAALDARLRALIDAKFPEGSADVSAFRGLRLECGRSSPYSVVALVADARGNVTVTVEKADAPDVRPHKRVVAEARVPQAEFARLVGAILEPTPLTLLRHPERLSVIYDAAFRFDVDLVGEHATTNLPVCGEQPGCGRLREVATALAAYVPKTEDWRGCEAFGHLRL